MGYVNINSHLVNGPFPVFGHSIPELVRQLYMCKFPFSYNSAVVVVDLILVLLVPDSYLLEYGKSPGGGWHWSI